MTVRLNTTDALLMGAAYHIMNFLRLMADDMPESAMSSARCSASSLRAWYREASGRAIHEFAWRTHDYVDPARLAE